MTYEVIGMFYTHQLQFWLEVVPLLLGLWVLKKYIFD